jgi:hypothetical protein
VTHEDRLKADESFFVLKLAPAAVRRRHRRRVYSETEGDDAIKRILPDGTENASRVLFVVTAK